MLVTGRKAWYLSTIQGNRYHINRIERDDEFIERMLDACEDFMRHVTEADPPEVDGSPSTSNAIAAMYPQEEMGESVDLDKYDGELIALQELANQKKNLDVLAEKYKNEIKLALGTAEYGESSQFKVTWRTDKRGARVFRFKEKEL